MDPLAQHAVRALSGEPDLAVPLPRLHARLEASLGRLTSGVVHLRRVLERHPDAFRILEPAPPRWQDPAWTEDARARYGGALRAVGMEPATPLALLVREPDPPAAASDEPAAGSPAEAALRRLDATLVGLCTHPDPPAALVQALGRVERVRRALRSLGTRDPDTRGDDAGSTAPPCLDGLTPPSAGSPTTPVPGLPP